MSQGWGQSPNLSNNQNQGWGINQQSSQGGWGGQQQPNQGSWGGQQQPNQGGWGGQQQPNQGGWGGQQQTNQGGWGGQQQSNQGWGSSPNQSQGWGPSPNQSQSQKFSPNQQQDQEYQQNQSQDWESFINQKQVWKPSPNLNQGLSSQSLFNQDNFFTITPTNNTNLRLSIDNWKRMIIRKGSFQPNQRFKFRFINGKYIIIAHEGLYLDACNIQEKRKRLKVNLPKNGSESQLWDILPLQQAGGGYCIRSYKDFVMCAEKRINGANVNQQKFNGGKNQVWIIQPC